MDLVKRNAKNEDRKKGSYETKSEKLRAKSVSREAEC